MLAFGASCKICVAIYAVLTGYCYFFTKKKTARYSGKKIWGLLSIYWLQLFTLFLPVALIGGFQLTPWNFVVNLFGLLPNINFFAWYVFFYIFAMVVLPFASRAFSRCKLPVNVLLAIVLPYLIEVALHSVPNYEEITLVHDAFSCFLYIPCVFAGYLVAQYDVIGKLDKAFCVHWTVALVGIVAVFVLRCACASIFGFLLDVLYAPFLVYFLHGIFGRFADFKPLVAVFGTMGKYSTEMWFFHAVFFSTYLCVIFQPVLMAAHWLPLVYVWCLILSLAGAFVYNKLHWAISKSFLYVKGKLTSECIN